LNKDLGIIINSLTNLLDFAVLFYESSLFVLATGSVAC